jgi:hypothetical protein
VSKREDNEFNLDIGMSGTACTLIIVKDGVIYSGIIGDALCIVSKNLNSVIAEKNI